VTVGTTAGRIWIGLAVLILIAIFVFASRGGGPAPGPGPTATRAGETSSSEPTGASREPSGAVDSPRPSSSERVVLVGAGDIAACNTDRDAATADLVESVDGIVFTLGDNVYDRGSAAEFAECFGPTWGRPSIMARTHPVTGNHDYGTAGAAGYFDYFGAAAGARGEGWYAYDAATWRIYVLNSNCAAVGGCGKDSAQLAWLRADLAANPRDCVAAMWHHPRFSSGEHGNDDRMQAAWKVLGDAAAELVLAGHDHDYERFAPQDEQGRPDDEHGMVELVVGTGGRSAYPFQSVRDNSLVRATDVFGVLRLELGATGYEFRFVAIPGEDFIDSGSGRCH
jgi:calcineurin-like phosphoesterase family protein